MKSRFLLAVPVLLSLALAGCFGGDTRKVDAEDWVDDICDATDDLADAEADAADDYSAVFTDAADDEGEDVRDALLSYIDDYRDAIDEFEQALDDAGEPDVRDGGKVVDAVRQFIADEREGLDDAEEDVKDLDEEDEELILAVDDVYFDIDFADLLELLEDSDARDGDDIIELIDENEECASYLFLD
jgi:hypothetical protein